MIHSLSNDYFCKSSQKHFDLIKSIMARMNHNNIHWKFFHIKGHQNNVIQCDDLNQLAQLNISTGIMTKDKLSNMIESINWERCRPQHLPFEVIEICWTNQQLICTKIISNLPKTLTTKICMKLISNYLIKKEKLEEHKKIINRLDYFKKRSLEITRQQQKWLSKWMVGFCVNRIMLKLCKCQNH
jgi:hypothetical protein